MAFMPVHLAVAKWPSSCRKIEMTTPTTNTKIQMLTNASHTNSPAMAAIATNPVQPLASSSSFSSVTDPPAMISLFTRSALLGGANRSTARRLRLDRLG